MPLTCATLTPTSPSSLAVAIRAILGGVLLLLEGLLDEIAEPEMGQVGEEVGSFFDSDTVGLADLLLFLAAIHLSEPPFRKKVARYDRR